MKKKLKIGLINLMMLFVLAEPLFGKDTEIILKNYKFRNLHFSLSSPVSLKLLNNIHEKGATYFYGESVNKDLNITIAALKVKKLKDVEEISKRIIDDLIKDGNTDFQLEWRKARLIESPSSSIDYPFSLVTGNYKNSDLVKTQIALLVIHNGFEYWIVKIHYHFGDAQLEKIVRKTLRSFKVI